MKMKRFILVGVRQGKDDKTKDDLLFLTLFKLPSKMKNGGLWHPKSAESIIYYCVNKTKNAEEYEKYSKVYPGTLFDVTFAVNDFNNKSYIATCVMVPGTNLYTDADLYI